MRSLMLAAALTTAWVSGSSVAAAQAPADPVARHRAAYRIITRDMTGYRHAAADMDSLGLERRSTDGGILEAYCQGAAIRLLVARYHGETGDATYRFHFDHDSLFFVLVDSRRGRPDGTTPYPKRTIVERARYYFTADRLVRWLGAGNKPQAVSSHAATEQETELLGDARRLRAAMTECRPNYEPE
jgi:hypothetical protein